MRTYGVIDGAGTVTNLVSATNAADITIPEGSMIALAYKGTRIGDTFKAGAYYPKVDPGPSAKKESQLLQALRQMAAHINPLAVIELEDRFGADPNADNTKGAR